MHRLSCRLLAGVAVVGVAIGTLAQQVADPDFDTRVAKPAYTSKHPKVLLDEAHNNFHTASGRYKPFADLITSDGYQVLPNKQRFSKETLSCLAIMRLRAAVTRARQSPGSSLSPGSH
jgi:hypothetical protein